MRAVLLAFSLLSIAPSIAISQTRSSSGRVADADRGSPVGPIAIDAAETRGRPPASEPPRGASEDSCDWVTWMTGRCRR